MHARMKNPVFLIPDAYPALLAVGKVMHQGLPAKTIKLVHLRASQINGCGVCVDMHARELQTLGETMVRLASVAAWRDTPFFDAAERAALALTEATTRICDREEAVSDAVWAEAAAHYDEKQLALLVMNIAQINFWNRVNVATKQLALGRAFTADDVKAAG